MATRFKEGVLLTSFFSDCLQFSLQIEEFDDIHENFGTHDVFRKSFEVRNRAQIVSLYYLSPGDKKLFRRVRLYIRRELDAK